jgi:hypothetical protein
MYDALHTEISEAEAWEKYVKPKEVFRIPPKGVPLAVSTLSGKYLDLVWWRESDKTWVYITTTRK